MSLSWSGVIYDSVSFDGNPITATSATGSGWLSMSTIAGVPTAAGRNQAIERMQLLMVPADFATTEALTVTYEAAYVSAGTAGFDLHVFAQFTNTNTVEHVALPGEESTGVLTAGTDLLPGLIPEFFRITWVEDVACNASFILYGAVKFA